ncbi:glutamate--cysteine ligase [Streptomyces sp. NPDC096033]|uniref:carboxylate-amine ligase n=1 Tax=Streptomyces sp. NPDC096033 TaxID=3366071 RepID=UPI0037F74E8E
MTGLGPLPTLGVEEEYLLLASDSAMPAPRVEQVRGAAALEAITSAAEVQTELLQAQVEVATPVCRALAEVGGHLLRLRHAMALGAESSGCRLALCGAAPVRDSVPVPVTPTKRYLGLQAYAPRLVDEQLINGMHVHVGVPDRAAGVEVLNRIRDWLPVLVAMAANSPLWEGRDTGFASWRTLVFGRWPVTGPPPFFDGVADYESRVTRLLGSGVIADRGQVYWQARLSEKYPTVEIRCPDLQLRADDAVMLAGIARALVATALTETRHAVPAAAGTQELLQAATWQAARHGLNGPLVDPRGRSRGAQEVVGMLMEHIADALADGGDARAVSSLVDRLFREGTGAERQRAAMSGGGMPALIDLITTRSTAL